MPEYKFKRLFFDIETSPNLVLSWRIGYNINLSPENIVEERRIICVSYKWEGEKKVHSLTWDQNKDDKKLLKEFIKILNQADEIVYQNGDRFDLPWIKTRCLFHKIQTLPSYKSFDTLKKIKSNFYLNSNRLDYVQKFTGSEGKISTTYSLWSDIFLNNCQKSLKKMVKYCEKDVRELEDLYHTILPYVEHNTHVGVAKGFPKYTCAHCGSFDLSKNKESYTKMGTVRIQMKCKSCKGHFTISHASYMAYLKEHG